MRPAAETSEDGPRARANDMRMLCSLSPRRRLLVAERHKLIPHETQRVVEIIDPRSHIVQGRPQNASDELAAQPRALGCASVVRQCHRNVDDVLGVLEDELGHAEGLEHRRHHPPHRRERGDVQHGHGGIQRVGARGAHVVVQSIQRHVAERSPPQVVLDGHALGPPELCRPPRRSDRGRKVAREVALRHWRAAQAGWSGPARWRDAHTHTEERTSTMATCTYTRTRTWRAARQPELDPKP